MRLIKDFVLNTINESTSTLVNGLSKHSLKIEGCQIDGQYQLSNNRFLLFITDDVDFEQCLHILLLSETCDIIDQIDIDSAYVTGVLSLLNIRSKSEITFEFIKSFKLTILDRGCFSFRKTSHNQLVKYRSRRQRWLHLDEY